METDRATRPRPEIIFVPPPDSPAIPRQRIVGILVWCAVVFLGVTALGLAIGGLSPSVWIGMFLAIWLLLLVVLVVVARQATRSLRAARQMFLQKHPTALRDPVPVQLARAWEAYDHVPKIDAVREALRDATEPLPADRATIICFGEPDVPEVGEMHFEPEIVTPTGSIWRQLHWIAIAGAILVLYLLDYVRLLPAWFPPVRAFLSGFLYFVVAGAVILMIWIWRALIRPTYIRMAPGIIQLVQFRSSRSNPTIRSYPIGPGTLVTVTRIRKRFTLTLARDDHRDMLQITQMQNPTHKIERLWQALLSTAPTPPLSDEELIG